jgi:superfamily II DNA or RNA helicase
MNYAEYLAHKKASDPATGITDPGDMHPALFGYQADIVRWALRRGRAAIFAGTGLGKTLMELAWAHAVADFTGKPVLIFTPLAVAAQFVTEGAKFGLPCTRAASQSDICSGVYVTNYDKRDRFDLTSFAGMVLDESSILKAHTGKTRDAIIAASQSIPFRLAATATPAPNDYMELGNHAEFLGVMSYAEMLAMFFVHDGGDTAKWRLKRHAESDFWAWMCSWAVMLTKPSDLGYDDAAHSLPPLLTHQHTVAVEYRSSVDTGMLFPIEARTMQERLGARRDSIADRVQCAAALINGNNRPWVAWCNLNTEADAMTKAIPGAVQVSGSDSEDLKEARLDAFARGDIRVIVTKPSICGFGMNWQHCADTAFVGLNDSFEQVFQAVRRFWRFGQTQSVNVHFIASEMEGAVVANLQRKETDANRMIASMVAHMADLTATSIKGVTRDKAGYAPKLTRIPSFMEQAA